jgi:tetratricopeptide (TPR) repeat protein
MSLTRVSASASPNLVPERLNDLGADLIEAGQYDEAIKTLVEGLKLIRQRRQMPQNTTYYNAEQCSLAECMKFSQAASKTSECCEDDDDNDGGDIFRQPIRIPVHDMQEHRPIADFTLLSLVFAFNLALAHQISATEGQLQMCRRGLEQAMQLYQLAYKWHLEEQGNKRIDSLHFVMVLVQNLGEIHRVLKNNSKYVRCLEHLLSALMRLVERETRNQMDYSIDLDGFLKNIAKLVLRKNCANAA